MKRWFNVIGRSVATSLPGRFLRSATLVLIVAAPLVPTSSCFARPDDDALIARLEAMTAKLDKRREEAHVPGLSFAIVKNDRIIFTRGLGLVDLETKRPAEPSTVYMVGSSTKAFTATLVGMMVDEGKMAWDEPAASHLPGFRLKDDDLNSKLTLRDMLSHRSGLARTDMAWSGGKASRAEVIAALGQAELKDLFRTKFNYNNPMFLAAGTAAANAAGADWDAMLKERIFTPLGMISSTSTHEALLADPHAAKGYKWNDDEKKYEFVPARSLNNVAPCGAINSDVLQMSSWVRLQIGRGTFEGRELVKPATIEETWKKTINVGGGVDYGMGWFLRTWNGKRVVEHGGNIDGYCSSVAFLPDDGVGYVMLENVNVSPLRDESMVMVFEALFPPAANADTAAVPADKLAQYVGAYQFEAKNMKMTALIKDSKLILDVPGQTAYELKWPDADGKWAFALTDTIKVKFNHNEAGKVETMTMFQGGLEFVMPKDGVTIIAKLDPHAILVADLQKYVGEYRFEPAKQNWTTKVAREKLILDVPGQMAYELKWPDSEGKWAFVATPDIKVSFQPGEGGFMKSVTLFQAGQALVMPRVGAAALNAAWPTVDELMAKRKVIADAADKLGAIRLIGTINFIHQGVSGSIDTLVRGDDQYLQDINLGVYGRSRSSMNKGRAWAESSNEPLKEIKGKELDMLRTDKPSTPWEDLRTSYDTVEVQGIETIEDQGYAVVKGAKKDGSKSVTQYVNIKTGLVQKELLVITVPVLGAILIEFVYADFRPLGDPNSIVKLSFQTTIKSDLNGDTKIGYSKVQTNVVVAADAFDLTPLPK